MNWWIYPDKLDGKFVWKSRMTGDGHSAIGYQAIDEVELDEVNLRKNNLVRWFLYYLTKLPDNNIF